MKRLLILPLLLVGATAFSQGLKLNDLEYFEETGVNVLAFNNQYNGMFCDEKTAGVELVQRGERIVTGGGVRLMNTPEQWDIYPDLLSRTVNRADQSVALGFEYPDYDFRFRMEVKARGTGFVMSVTLDEPLPAALAGKAGLNLEFFPASYFGKTLLVDGKAMILPRYPAGETAMHPVSEKITQFFGLSTFDDRGRNEFIVPAPFATGHKLVLAPEDQDLRVTISSDSELNLFDGRNLAQNGTFVVRTFLPAGKTGQVVEWEVQPSFDPAWVREPNIGISQIGYTPAQKKVAVLELDRNDPVAAEAKVLRIDGDGTAAATVFPVSEWGVFFNRYNYATVDFSAIREPGLYCLEYKGVRTNPFPVDKDVYAGTWHTTMDVWLPVQMDHMEVNEGYRIWHGRSHMDDALQAPVNYEQQDGYRQGPVTNTKYASYEHIPGLAVGAWYDAGDFDIQAGTVIGLTTQFATLWEAFHLDRDQTYIDQETQFVDIHRPDGVPDVIQQVEHGVLNVNAQVENIGFVAQGIVQGTMHQYHHLGDAVTITDGLVYDSSLPPYVTRGVRSGTRDDRFAFTGNGNNPAGQMSTIAALAAAARVLKPFNPALAERSLNNAVKLWNENYEKADPAGNAGAAGGWGMAVDGRIQAAIQLWRTTGEKKYRDFFEPRVLAQLKPQEPAQNAGFRRAGQAAARGVEVPMADLGAPMFVGGFIRQADLTTALSLYDELDDAFRAEVRKAVPAYAKNLKAQVGNNPYGVPVGGRFWGGNEQVITWAYNNYLVWKRFPDLVDPEDVLAGLNFLYGCHPYSNVSFVTSVGVNTKKVAYGNNRADYTVIPGGIVPGLLVLAPDLFENKDDYPFLWGENECCTRTVPSFVSLSLACEEVAASLK
jgi:hypothetical protein